MLKQLRRLTLGLALGLGLGLGSLPVAAAVVLQYHHVDDQTPALTSVTPALFAEHMAYLDQAGFAVWPLDQLMVAIRQGDALPDKVVAISFDDGYRSILHHALPVLEQYHFPFTVFVNPGLVGSNSDYLNWDELRHLQTRGGLIANHTLDHPHLIRRLDAESEAAWSARVSQQIAGTEERLIQELGETRGLLAYPYGEYDRAVQAIVERLGLLAFAQHSGAIGADVDPYAIPRFPFGGSYGDMPDFITKVNTLPLPNQGIRLFSSAGSGTELQNPLLPQGVDRPLLEISLPDARLASALTCFASGQGAIAVVTEGATARTQPSQALPTGRSRINCTAPSGQPGRFYWYSHLLIRQLPDGSWYQEY